MASKAGNNHVVAHRGAFKKNGFPENSIAALREAIRLGCAGSEFDVRMSSDDSLVINHDPRFQEMEIETSSYNELISKRLSNGEKFPTLREFLSAALVNNSGTQLVIEIKPSDISKDRGKAVAEKVVDLVNEFNAQNNVCYISFDYDILGKVKELYPKAITQYLNGDYTPEQLKADGISGADYNLSAFKEHPEWIARAQKEGLILNTWTVNNPEDMNWFLDNNFDFITTNEPELLMSLVNGR